jgi:hypothetical protein
MLITDDAIAIRIPQWRRMMIRDLRDPHVVITQTSWFSRRRTYQLCATYRNHTVCLFSTTDRAEFGSARRALTRAFERERERREETGVSLIDTWRNVTRLPDGDGGEATHP